MIQMVNGPHLGDTNIRPGDTAAGGGLELDNIRQVGERIQLHLVGGFPTLRFKEEIKVQSLFQVPQRPSTHKDFSFPP